MLQDAESSGWSQELGKKAEEYCLTTIGGLPQVDLRYRPSEIVAQTLACM